MLYLSDTPIHHTSADAIVVPITLDGQPVAGSLWQTVVDAMPDEFLDDLRSEIREEVIGRGDPGYFVVPAGQAGPAKKAVIVIPVGESSKDCFGMRDIFGAMVHAVRSAPMLDIRTMAVGPLDPEFTWESQEELLKNIERTAGHGMVELWAYPPVGADEDAEGVVLDAEWEPVMVGI